MATNLTIAVNNDTSDQPYGTSGIDWTDLDLVNDYLIFTAGSDVVKDGESLPSQTDLNQAGIVLTGEQIIIDKYLLADFSENELKEIHNMGNQNKRYVLALVFDDATASEPVLELWDNTDLNSIASISLGAETPANSWFKGITTTDALPGADWTGNALAGASDGHFLYLNNQAGALSSAKTLYCNLKIVVPSSADESGSETPVIAVKYTTN
jgi:hypothetical protein